MKYAVIVPDGMADTPRPELRDKTPMEVARDPNMQAVAKEGRVGLVRTIPEGMDPGSDVAILSIMGYDPREHHTGRAGLEAVGMGVELAPHETAFRCNLVTVSDDQMVDYSAGHISTKEAGVLIALLNERLGGKTLRFHAGVGYRHLAVLSGEEIEASTSPPHDIMGRAINDHWPRGKGKELLKRIMLASREVLSGHDVNTVRIDLGENPANMIWLWGAGRAPTLPSFKEKFGVSGAVICGVQLVRSLGICAGWEVIDVPGATGYLDTDYGAKGKAAVEALGKHDFVFVHVEAPDEAAHEGNVEKKIAAIEAIDRSIVGPVLAALRSAGDFRIMVLPDHATPIEKQTHVTDPVPFAVAGSGFAAVCERSFTERDAQESDLKVEEGHRLMEFFLAERPAAPRRVDEERPGE